ncbi:MULTISPECIES: helix-hairpin-helix domain-containing protein [unclassified Sutcliffiella]|uniref:helix-hairpin-helix domain-containing protein n=1 Tax=unclassified Sutcliffiella TaxID=2837532 RepID=UPI0030D107E9
MKELWYVHKTKVLIVISVVVLFCFFIWSRLYVPTETQAEQQVSFLMEATEAESEEDLGVNDVEQETSQPINKEVLIDIKGAVFQPGVYKMKSGDRVIDAVEVAGGFLDDADTRKVNLASLLTDEMVIIVPREGDEEEREVLIKPENSSNADSAGGKININSASEEELTALTGVGPAKAKAIIDYRTDHGLYKSIEEIMNVTGIGEKSFEKLKDEITVAN